MTKPVPTLKQRKHEAVRQGIWDVATDLFHRDGYDETTVDDIAEAAGISQRTFFRYFASKSDLMAYSLLSYGEQLVAAIGACPRSRAPREVFRETVLHVARQALANQPRSQRHIDVLKKSPAAAAAEMSHLAEVQALVAKAYAKRLPAGAANALTAGVLAGVTLQLTGITVRWCLDHRESDPTATIDRLLAVFEGIFCGPRRRA